MNNFRVLSYDPARLQFAADLQTPMQDSGSLYVLTSRFHRFFLKNLDTRDINIRILRLPGATLPSASIPSATASYTIGNTISYPTSASPSLYKNELSISSQRPGGLNALKTSVVDNYFNSIRQPYQYESVGIINSANKNPFTALNTGERPHAFLKSQPQFNSYNRPTTNYHHSIIENNGHFGVTYLPKISNSFTDFNSLRRAKSISYNSTVLH